MSIWLFLLAVHVLAPLFAQTAQPSPPVRVPTRADILRGEYGPYRANNDLLFYHLDVRVDPEKKYLSGRTPSASKCCRTPPASSSTCMPP